MKSLEFLIQQILTLSGHQTPKGHKYKGNKMWWVSNKRTVSVEGIKLHIMCKIKFEGIIPLE